MNLFNLFGPPLQCKDQVLDNANPHAVAQEHSHFSGLAAIAASWK
jgi:hypothetical protein